MAPSLIRRVALVGAAVALAALSMGPSNTSTVMAAGVPAATMSFYVYGSFIDVCGVSATTECPLYDFGAGEAIPPGGGMTILDFGAPCFEPATLEWGTQLFNSQSCTPDRVLVMLAESWLRGFAANPNASASTAYVVALGTSNSLTAAVPGNALTAPEMALHGREWFTSVVGPAAAAARAIPNPPTVWAGDDIEEARDGNWYDGPTTTAWVDAYAAASRATKPCIPGRSGLMVDYGDYVPNEPGWSPGDVYHVAWGAAPACPVPEIYLSANAAEWASLNRFAVGAGLPAMQFAGVLSQDGAGETLSGIGSWSALLDATGQAPPYLSVIGVTGPVRPEVPDSPTGVTAVPGPGLVTLAWSAPAWDGGAAVTVYTITVYSRSAVVQTVPVSGSPTPETAIVAGLNNGTSYTFYVSATNRVGTGPQSPPSASVAPSSLFPLH